MPDPRDQGRRLRLLQALVYAAGERGEKTPEELIRIAMQYGRATVPRPTREELADVLAGTLESALLP